MKALWLLLGLVAALALAGVVAAPPPAEAAVDRDCADFDNQRQAQNHFLDRGGPRRDPDRLDADRNGSPASPCLAPAAAPGPGHARSGRAGAPRRSAGGSPP
jgi:hypothetical protein